MSSWDMTPRGLEAAREVWCQRTLTLHMSVTPRGIEAAQQHRRFDARRH